MTQEEVELLSKIVRKEKLPVIPSWLVQTNKTVIAFGGYASMFSLGQIATGKERFTQSELLSAIQQLAGKGDEQLLMFPEPQKVTVGLTLLYSVMNHCGMEEILYKRTNGGCEGLLIIPRYWE